MNNQRVAGISMETRAVLAQPDALSGGLVVYTSTQNPHTVRQQIAGCSASPSRVRVIAPEVGGGFGVKIAFYPEEMISRPGAAAEAAGQVDRDAQREPATTHHGRGQHRRGRRWRRSATARSRRCKCACSPTWARTARDAVMR